jgi:predicted HTH domain antitoxin
MSSPPTPSQTQTCTLTVDLPEVVVRLLASTTEEAALRLKELALIELFRQGEVSSGWAAEQLGITKTDFLDLLYRHGVPYFDMSEDESLEQLQAAKPNQPTER